MERIAFKMKLHKGCEAEYEQRHDAIRADLKELLKSKGIVDYSIFLDTENNDLFGVFSIEDKSRLDDLPQHPVMKRWWHFMSDIMLTNDDKSPVTIPLKEVFYLE